MKIEKNKVVELSYELQVDGQVADVATAEQPLDYIHGTHMLIPRFESEIEGLEPGADFAFHLTPEEGYGTYDPAKKVNLSKEAFRIDGVIHEELIEIGRTLPMLDSTGNAVMGTIVSATADTVTMDFNHPMAGKDLFFTGKVLTVRDATQKELDEGLHGEFLPKEGCCHHGKGGGCCHHGEHHHGGEGCCHGEGHGHGEGCCHHGEGGTNKEN